MQGIREDEIGNNLRRGPGPPIVIRDADGALATMRKEPTDTLRDNRLSLQPGLTLDIVLYLSKIGNDRPQWLHYQQPQGPLSTHIGAMRMEITKPGAEQTSPIPSRARACAAPEKGAALPPSAEASQSPNSQPAPRSRPGLALPSARNSHSPRLSPRQSA